MSARDDIDADALYQQVMNQPAVQAKVMARAAKIATVARRDMARGGVEGSVSVVRHSLPTGRASFDVRWDGKDKHRRRAARVLRRAGRGAR